MGHFIPGAQWILLRLDNWAFHPEHDVSANESKIFVICLIWTVNESKVAWWLDMIFLIIISVNLLLPRVAFAFEHILHPPLFFLAMSTLIQQYKPNISWEINSNPSLSVSVKPELKGLSFNEHMLPWNSHQGQIPILAFFFHPLAFWRRAHSDLEQTFVFFCCTL